MSYVKQRIDALLSQSSGLTWRQGGVLLAPRLLGPKDGANLCSPQADIENFITGASSGLNLRWSPVAGATYYVVQWSNNSSFNGPTVNGVRVTHPITSYPISLYTGIDLSRQVYWRVMAFSSSGDVSSKSETWSFTYECNDLGLNAENKTIGCEAYNVEMQIRGPDYVKGDGTQALYHLDIQWDCQGESSEGDYAGGVSLVGVVWSVEQSTRNPVSIVCQNSNFAILDIQSSTSEGFTVKATATFQVDGSLIQFECSTHKDVTIDADTINLGEIRHGRIVCSYGSDSYLVGFVDRVVDSVNYSPDPDLSGSASDDACDQVDPEVAAVEADCFGGGSFETDTWMSYPFPWVESAEPTSYAFATDILRKFLNNGRKTYPVGTDVLVAKMRQPVSASSSSSSSEECNNDKETSWWIIRADAIDYPTLLVKGQTDVAKGNLGTFAVYIKAEGDILGQESCIGSLAGYCRIGDYFNNTWAYANYINGTWEITAADCEQLSSSG